MKFIHLSDLHLGKRLNECPLIEDQAYILKKILGIADAEQPDAVLIAGDVYDKSVPGAEVVLLFDDFLTRLQARGIPVCIVSGNHDSAERLSFGARLMERSGVYIARAFTGETQVVRLQDAYGPVNVYLLPFFKPVQARRFFEEEIESYTDAVRAAVERMAPPAEERSVLVAHQFVTGALRAESEELSVGGTDNVDVSVFAPFDYVALGHIHRPQNCAGPRVRYCGTPLKYSFSEARDEKSVTVAELGKKGELLVRTVPLQPLRELRELRGAYGELMLKSFYEGADLQEAFTHITLTDAEDIPDAVGRLRTVYRNLLKLDYDNARTRAAGAAALPADAESKSPFELFADFYLQRNGQPMSDTQAAYAAELIETIWEGNA